MEAIADETMLATTAVPEVLMLAFSQTMAEMAGQPFAAGEVAALALANELVRGWLESELVRRGTAASRRV